MRQLRLMARRIPRSRGPRPGRSEVGDTLIEVLLALVVLGLASVALLIATHPVRNLIREGRSNQIANVMFTNAKEGMQTMENSLAMLINENIITYEDALGVSGRPKELVRTLEQMGSRAVVA